ncbi:MAG TPA: DUF1501 domain-containing protein, partial [Planctomycetaceae bacterium]|nr:DUF1501 domain-containing protein [Planctomycetaceae bacterium]
MTRSFCDGWTRRDALTIGAAALPAFGLSLNALLHAQASEPAAAQPRDDVSLIVLFLKGGLSTIDTLDMKPQAPV